MLNTLDYRKLFIARVFVASLLSCALVACSDDDDNPPNTQMDGGVQMNNSDAGTSSGRDAGMQVTEKCNNPPLVAPASGTCSVTTGNANTLIRGAIVVAGGELENGHVLVSSNGKIVCAACDCSAAPEFAGATVIECADGVISPGLINGHEHLNFSEGPPQAHPEERFDHRHDWRRGKNGHTRIPSPRNQGGGLGILWGELRHLMGGATTINGSGGADGLLRNIDQNDPRQGGLGLNSVEYSTFPLGDSSGATRANDCNYSKLPSPDDTSIRDSVAYAPHISEGINQEARNEFVCLSQNSGGGQDVLLPTTSIIHAVGITPADINAIAVEQASVIWSPRTNIDLYGHTAHATLMARSGVRLALGTDWVVSGSMNMLRELQCVDSLNRNNYGSYFSDREIVDMATKNGAEALGAGTKIGTLATGYEADISIFRRNGKKSYRAIIEARTPDVSLVMRSGTLLYGDQNVIKDVLGDASGCEMLDVCGTPKMVCIEKDSGSSIQTIRNAIMSNPYETFYCGEPPLEPTCVPYRPGEFMGIPTAEDSDGDGIINDLDLCPTIFSPTRPLENGEQADADNDMIGDVCDPCPLDAFATDCKGPNPDDRDNDGVNNDVDNCPDVANMDQSDRDQDMKGDVCDPCPDQANPGDQACLVSVYEIKQGQQMGNVRISGVIVTAIGESGYFVQMPTDHPLYDVNLGAKFSGLFIFANTDMKPAVGDIVDIQGETTVFFDQTQLQNSTFTVTASSQTLPSAVVESASNVATGGTMATALEGVLVEVQNVTVTAVEPEAGPGDRAPTNEFVVADALRVNDYLYLTEPFPVVGDAISFIRGILRYGNGNSKIEPRSSDDVGLKPALREFTPSELFVETGFSGVPPNGFTIALTRAAESDILVSMSSSDSAVSVSDITIPAGQVSADVSVTVGVAAPGQSVIITGTYDGKSVTATVYPYQDSFPRYPIEILLADRIVRPNDFVTGNLTLNLPGASMGSAVSLEVMPDGLAIITTLSSTTTESSSVSVAAGQRIGDFALVASSTLGNGMVIARDINGTVTASAAFEVTNSVTREPDAGDLIITEVFRNPGGNQPEKVREWFEVFNPTGDTLVLDGLVIEDNGGANRAFTITSAQIGPGEYGIFAYSADPGVNGGLTALVSYEMADLQLSNSGDRLKLILGTTVIDEVEWGSGWPGAGNGTAMCLKFPYGDNSQSSSWADSNGTFGTNSETGHPGVASDSSNCP